MSTHVTGNQVAVAVVGLGTIGQHAARLLLDRPGAMIVGAVDPVTAGQSLTDVVGSPDADDIVVSPSLAEIIERRPHAVVYATGSFIHETADDLVQLASNGVNVVSPCEELAYPYTRFRDQAVRIDEAAHSGDATVVGTGVNPGFIFDTLLATASGVCWDVDAIRGRRVVDVSGFGENIHLRLGIGYSREEFESGHADGSIAGHVGFPESVEMVCRRFGLELDRPVEEAFEPFVAETPAPARYGAVEAGKTEGFIQRATGWIGGEPFVQLELLLHLRPSIVGAEPADTINIEGRHPIHLTLQPGMDAVLATSAVLVNSIPAVVAAEPGLRPVTDLPAAAAWLGEARLARPREL